jgi:hypothetical protein
VGIPFSQFRDVLLWVMVAVTIWSGIDYVRRAIGLLKPDTKK